VLYAVHLQSRLGGICIARKKHPDPSNTSLLIKSIATAVGYINGLVQAGLFSQILSQGVVF
jgi:hypothetical protein